MISSPPQISVIIPTFNRSNWIGKSIQSVVRQTFSDFELIVVDDGSTDDTSRIVKGFDRVHYIRCESNNGVSRARNVGIQQARGRWICFLDSDDLWADNKLETQFQGMKEHPDYRVSYTDEIWIRNGVRVNPMNKHRKHSGDIFKHCLPLCIVSPSSVMLEASLLAETGGFDETLPACEDYDLWLRIAVKYPFHFINEPLIIKQGGHLDQLSRKYWGMDRFRVRAILKLLDSQLVEGERLQLTRQTLLEKCGILANGFAKRGNGSEADYYRSLIEKYSD